MILKTVILHTSISFLHVYIIVH